MGCSLSALCQIKDLKFPDDPEGGVPGAVGYKADRPIHPRQPEIHDSAFAPVRTPGCIVIAVIDEKNDEAVCTIARYFGHSMHCITHLYPYSHAKNDIRSKNPTPISKNPSFKR